MSLLFYTVCRRAFRVSRPKVSSKNALEAFALFTKEKSANGEPERMYDVFYRLGQKVKKLSGLTDPKELEELIFFLYRNIEIDMHGSLENEVWIYPCYFSRYYTPEQCALMSNMDAGYQTGQTDLNAVYLSAGWIYSVSLYGLSEFLFQQGMALSYQWTGKYNDQTER